MREITPSFSFSLQCRVCGKAFACQSLLNRHIKVVITSLFYLSLSFSLFLSFSLSLFLSRKRPPLSVSFYLSIYLLIYVSTLRFQIHETRGHICDECDKGFTSAVKLKRHMQSHEGNKHLKVKRTEKELNGENGK